MRKLRQGLGRGCGRGRCCAKDLTGRGGGTLHGEVKGKSSAASSYRLFLVLEIFRRIIHAAPRPSFGSEVCVSSS